MLQRILIENLYIFDVFKVSDRYCFVKAKNEKRKAKNKPFSHCSKRQMFFKEAKSVTLNIFRKKKTFLFKSFVKTELSYVFIINMFGTAENCMEK